MNSDLPFKVKWQKHETTIIFKRICEVIPKRDENGKVYKHSPTREETNIIKHRGKKIHKYGRGPFCKFKIFNGFSGKSGVYMIKVDGVIRYVGKTEDLQHRFNAQYGSISARNCYEGGPETTCRINNLIFLELEKIAKVELYFYEVTPATMGNIESYFIETLNPTWNRTIS